jgi:hypothetical protein
MFHGMHASWGYGVPSIQSPSGSNIIKQGNKGRIPSKHEQGRALSMFGARGQLETGRRGLSVTRHARTHTHTHTRASHAIISTAHTVEAAQKQTLSPR